MNYYSQGAPLGSLGQNQQYAPSAFQSLIYAFPKPRIGGRITKPRSAGNSPSSAGRRRTTTMPHSSAMYQPVPSQDQAPLNAALLAAAINRRRSRPISWHPASRQAEYSVPAQFYQPNMAMNSYNFPAPHATQQQMMNDAIEEQMLQQMSEVPMQQTFVPEPASHQEPFMQMDNSQFDGGVWDGSGLPYVQSMNDWSYDMDSVNQKAPSVGAPPSNYGSVSSPGRLTEPPTPDFLPIQQFSDADQQKPSLEKDNSEELVGMGLYDKPDTFVDGLLYGTNGKGLKLEETFTPSSHDDENDEEDDQEESDAQQQSNSHQHNKPVDNMQKSFFFEDDEPTMAESGPSFNFAAPPCMNYGYGWI
ncbi:hypothetical protein BDV18DRAFT_147492 [Aspergillus unguis]